MKVITKPSTEREVTLSATLDELADLHAAVSPGGRSSKKANQIRAVFAKLLSDSDSDLATLIEAQREEATNGGDDN